MLGGTNVTAVLMDQLLQEEFLDDTQWTVRLSNLDQDIVDVQTIGSTAFISSTDGAGDAGPDVVSYNDASGDLRNRFGQLSADDFTDFAIT